MKLKPSRALGALVISLELIQITALFDLKSPIQAQVVSLEPSAPQGQTQAQRELAQAQLAQVQQPQPMIKERAMTQRAESPRGALNVLGTPLKQCCSAPMTGFERDGFCHTGPYDRGRHVVCAQMTEAFLNFTSSCGNDLSTPRPEYGFPGLKPGDGWCLCATRWAEAEEEGVAPPVDLEATHESALQIIPLELLKRYAKVAPKDP